MLFRSIKNDLLSVPANTQIVIVQHIPVAATENFGELAAILLGRKEILVLSAHTHTLRRNIFNFNNVLVHEINAGTACGTFWLGEQSWNQIPVAIMNCGTPPCYFTIDFNEKDYKIDFKAIGFDADMQMDIWINNKIKSEKEKKGRMPEKEVSEIAETEIFPQGAIVANIFGACDSTTVQISIDNGPFLPMTHTPAISPRVS